MINLLRGLVYFVVLVLIQVLILNNIHFLRIATPFLYLYFIIKMPVGTSRDLVVLFSFLLGLVIDMFSNTPGMHAAACTLAGFIREPLIRFFMGKDLPEGIYPSYKTFGYGGFFRYVLSFCGDPTCHFIPDRIVDAVRSVIPCHPYRGECGNDYIINLYNRSIQYRDTKEWRLIRSIHLRTGVM